ncbi:hypothetical protein DXG03_009348 [Asterophora parasitica]|uniref:Fungal lipase-type domain-containing protein n=1 Tax=Asterophora parasitica TaxID=117018 RepID=A0A9P7KDJ7_9AGAR|nr:hypothetical protein DXG03_009348 [Asterophora parasitica]
MLGPSTLLWALPFLQVALAAPLFKSLFDTDPVLIPASVEAPVAITAKSARTDFLRPAKFARVAYCSSEAVTSWKCGDACESLGGGIKVLQAGGDDGLVPMLVIFGNSCVGWPENIRVHEGFQKTFERTADGVLAGVKAALATAGVNKVVVTGHSLGTDPPTSFCILRLSFQYAIGAAVAMMDALMLTRELGPSGVEVNTTLFGLPRGGNAAWADFIDSTLGDSMVHLSNQNDPVPTLPPRFLGYQHPGGEVRIDAVGNNGDPTEIAILEGQENENGSFKNSIFNISIPDHLGPYLGNVSFGDKFCPF